MSNNPEKFRAVVMVESVRRQVETELRRAIVQGQFPPGTHLSDRLLQDTFQVSRTVIREAVRQVEAEGLIETYPHRGSFVLKLSAREAEQVYAVRGVLEGLAAREFVREASDDEVDQLERIVSKIRKQLTRRQLQEIVDLKREFYEVLLTGCRNPYIKTMLSPLLNINAQLRATSLSDPDRLPHTVTELEALVKALRSRKTTAAWEASLRHVQNAAAVALKLIALRDAQGGAPITAKPERKCKTVPVMGVS